MFGCPVSQARKVLAYSRALAQAVRDGVPVVNSRNVAAEFEKEHRHVLRDIDVLISARPDLGALKWFRRTDYLGSCDNQPEGR